MWFEKINEVLFLMLMLNLEEYKIFINNDFLENIYRKKYYIKYIFESNDIVVKIKYYKKIVILFFVKLSLENFFLFCNCLISYM